MLSQSAARNAGPKIEIIEGDLLAQKVDVIVNAWNQNLIPYWMLVTQGVSGAIKKHTGSAPFKKLRENGVMQLGEARFTEAPGLPFKGIIHVAGINHLWKSSEYSIRHSVQNALALAQSMGMQSIAFPAIGAGSSITLRSGREISVLGVSTAESLRLIEDEAKQSGFQGQVIIVKYKKS